MIGFFSIAERCRVKRLLPGESLLSLAGAAAAALLNISVTDAALNSYVLIMRALSRKLSFLLMIFAYNYALIFAFVRRLLFFLSLYFNYYFLNSIII